MTGSAGVRWRNKTTACVASILFVRYEDMPAKRKNPRKKCAGIPAHPRCRNLTALRQSGPRKGKSKGALCHRCRTAVWRKNNPMRAAYHRLKSHAADREILFTITFAEFECFAKRTEYLCKTGPFGHSLTVDRKNNLLGYTAQNIKAMTRAKNSEKLAKRDQIRMERGYGWQTKYASEAHPF